MSDALRIGIIGCDTSHSVEYAARLNDSSNPDHIPGARITVACPTMSPDMPWSRNRAEGFVKELQEERGVRLVDGIPALLAECDAVLLCSLDGRPHPQQARPILEAQKPVFIDKPIGASYREASDLLRLADQMRTPAFGASAIRWYPGVLEVAQADVGAVRGAFSYGPSPIEPTHPDLFFYGIHPTEALFTVLGPGCRSVQRTTTKHTSVVVGAWEDGRVGTLHLMHRWPAEYKVIKFGDERVVEQTHGGDYTPQLREIVKFFQTGVAPVTPEQTLEIYAFMEAADESKRRGGAAVLLSEVMTA
jgi:predicted dehydrogenase